MIPQKLHLFWGGSKPVPDMALRSIEFMERLGWTHRIWRPEDLPFFATRDWLVENERWSILSDFCRHWAVYENGGVYMDTDIMVMKNFEPLIKHYAWFATSEPPKYVNCAFSGGEPGNRVSRLMLSHFTMFDFHRPSKLPYEVLVGPHMATDVIRQYFRIELNPNTCMEAQIFGKGPFKILPCHIGFGLDYTQFHYGKMDFPPAAYCRHYWTKQW